mmetsp:Transcript_9246/g.30052  ORF Transcript_9246/g.30052 Transcript_9246/m.30052 type:complete len:140 (+) Transcript_9246:105-524(+)
MAGEGEKYSLDGRPVHLGLGARAEVQPAFTGSMEWYKDYSMRTASDGREGRLVALYSFTEPWTVWEMHPKGDEVVLCTAGRVTLIQEVEEGERAIELDAGEYAINPAGVWHTADTDGATCVFITAGEGTEHKDRVLPPP